MNKDSFVENENYINTYNLLFDSNIFSILNIDCSEISHTKIIEWILSLNHYQGLKKLIKWYDNNIDITKIDEESIVFYNDKPFNIMFNNSSLSNRPDLFINTICNKEEYYILIENKIDAFENEYENNKYQTELYYEEIKKIGLKNVLYIFLDAKDNNPKCDKYKNLNYDDFYNNIIKTIEVTKSNDKFIYTQYVNSLLKPKIINDDFTIDTIYAINKDVDYNSMYSEDINDYIKRYDLLKEHSVDEVKKYLTIKYIYYCIDYNGGIEIDPIIKQILFGTEKKKHKWKYNGVYSSNISIIKKICMDLKKNKEIELLNKISSITINKDKLIVYDLEYESKKDSWIKWCKKHKTTIEDYYIKLFDNFYMFKYIPYETMIEIANLLNNNYKLEEE